MIIWIFGSEITLMDPPAVKIGGILTERHTETMRRRDEVWRQLGAAELNTDNWRASELHSPLGGRPHAINYHIWRLATTTCSAATMLAQRALLHSARRIPRQLTPKRNYASQDSGLQGAQDNPFNRERAAVKHHAAETSGMLSHLLDPCHTRHVFQLRLLLVSEFGRHR